MKPSTFSDAQKAFILKQRADGMPVAGNPPASRNQPGDPIRFADLRFNWKLTYDRLPPAEMRGLRQLQDGNAKLREDRAPATFLSRILRRGILLGHHTRSRQYIISAYRCSVKEFSAFPPSAIL